MFSSCVCEFVRVCVVCMYVCVCVAEIYTHKKTVLGPDKVAIKELVLTAVRASTVC